MKGISNAVQTPLRCFNPQCDGVQKKKDRCESMLNFEYRVLNMPLVVISSTPVMVCLSCGQRQCQRHQCIHEGYSCKQWDKKKTSFDRRNEYLSNDWLSKNTKVCPGDKCGRRVRVYIYIYIPDAHAREHVDPEGRRV